MIRKYSCATKDFSVNYSGFYSDGPGGAIVNVKVNGPSTSFEIKDNTIQKTYEVKKQVFMQNEPKKK